MGGWPTKADVVPFGNITMAAAATAAAEITRLLSLADELAAGRPELTAPITTRCDASTTRDVQEVELSGTDGPAVADGTVHKQIHLPGSLPQGCGVYTVYIVVGKRGEAGLAGPARLSRERLIVGLISVPRAVVFRVLGKRLAVER